MRKLTHSLYLAVLAVVVAFHEPAIGSTPSSDVWTIDSGEIDPAHYFGETVANGMIGIVSVPLPFRTGQTLLSGVYDISDQNNANVLLNAFNILQLGVAIDDVAITQNAQVQQYRQTLDLRHASLTTQFKYGDKATIRYTWYALRQLPYTALADVTIVAHKSITLSATSSLEPPAPLRDAASFAHRFQDIDTPAVPLTLLTATARGPTKRLLVSATTAFRFETWKNAPEVTPRTTDNGTAAIGFTSTIPAGGTLRFTLVGSTIASLQNANPRNASARLTIAAALKGRDTLLAQHNRAWDALWASDIRIEGDDRLQRDVHAMLYHLYSFSREGTAYSLPPMGLSDTVIYAGHVFWDADIWMFPVLLALHPEIARSLLMYRIEGLPAARRNAVANGYRGAMFPWESAATGDEETPLCCLTGPFQHHITADVGIAAWQYHIVTQDIDWLREHGWPLLRDTAAFWASRVERNGPGQYDIRSVVAADEWSGVVDNNAFTNAAAKANLTAAIKAAKILGRTPDPDWQTVLDNIPILKFADGVTREHATYHGEKIKQADVNLLSFPLHEITDPAAIRRDMAYYAPRIGDGPAMTHSIFAVLHARLGEPHLALAEFKRGYKPNQRPPFGVLAEAATNNAVYFATGAGGLLQAMLYGFGGLELTDSGLLHTPVKLPAGWKSLTLTGIGPQKRTFVIRQE